MSLGPRHAESALPPTLEDTQDGLICKPLDGVDEVHDALTASRSETVPESSSAVSRTPSYTYSLELRCKGLQQQKTCGL